jgi:hypothetical protein
VAAGGNTGGNTTNANAVLVAALGRCDDLFTGGGSSSVGTFTGGFVNINELTTIAAAYALGPFSSVSGTGSSTVVQIGAPSTNNAPEISSVSTGCIANVGSCGTTTVAAGLYHAFLNAANLVNTFSSSNPPTANSTVTAYTSSYGVPMVPQQLINSIANSLVACVNSGGGAIGDGSACGTILDLTTLPTGHIPSWTAATPTNTFSAVVNLAANPTLSGVTPTGSDCPSMANVACFFGVATAQTSIYSPALTSSTGINDYSISIYFPSGLGSSTSQFQTITLTNGGVGYSSAPTVGFSGGCTTEPTAAATYSGTTFKVTAVTITVQGSGCTSTPAVTFTGGSPTTPATAVVFVNTVDGCGASTCQGLIYPTSGALDINDIYYLTNSNSAGGGATSLNLFAFSSNGTVLKSTPTPGTTAKSAYGLSVDGLGNGYFGNGGNSTATTGLAAFTTGAGSPSSYTLSGPGGTLKVYSTAVDQHNNLWAFGTSTTNSLYKCAAGGTSCSGQGTFNTTSVTSNSTGAAIDSNQNVWTATGTTLVVLPNNGTLSAPTYTATQVTASTTGSPVNGIAFTFGPNSTPTAYNVAYGAATPGIQPYSPTYGGTNGFQLTALNQGTNTTVSSTIGGPQFSAEGDGAGNVWLADTRAVAVTQFIPNSTPANDTAYRLNPCLPLGSTTCTGTFVGNPPQTVSIDSTGSIWVTQQSSNNGGVTQIIGAAAPTWPLLSLGRTGRP